MAKREKPAAEGHNGADDKLLKSQIKHILKLEKQKIVIAGQIKDEYLAAKNNGFKVTAMRKTVKRIFLSTEQEQARKSIESETERYVTICEDLFAWADEQQDETAAA